MKDNIIDFKDHSYEECLDFIYKQGITIAEKKTGDCGFAHYVAFHYTGITIAQNVGAAKLIEIVQQILSIVEDIEKD